MKNNNWDQKWKRVLNRISMSINMKADVIATWWTLFCEEGWGPNGTRFKMTAGSNSQKSSWQKGHHIYIYHLDKKNKKLFLKDSLLLLLNNFVENWEQEMVILQLKYRILITEDISVTWNIVILSVLTFFQKFEIINI